jgi:glycerol-3-phosphate acyltransferase PlsY
VEGTAQRLRLHAVSATSVRLQMGNRFGCLTSLLDMVKVALPTLAFRLLWPDSDAYLVAAACGVLGHNWPLFARFRGGYGQSPTFGGLMVIDWSGAVVVFVATLLVGIVTRQIYVALLGGFLTLIPWFWLRYDDSALLLYAVAVNVAYAIKLLPDFRQYMAIRRQAQEVLPGERSD